MLWPPFSFQPTVYYQNFNVKTLSLFLYFLSLSMKAKVSSALNFWGQLSTIRAYKLEDLGLGLIRDHMCEWIYLYGLNPSAYLDTVGT